MRMVRRNITALLNGVGSPHTRGDGPVRLGPTGDDGRFFPHAWGWPPSSQAALCFMAFGENGESNFNSHNRDDANVLENMSDSLKP